MFNKLKKWLFPTEIEGFDYNAVDRDGDGKVQEGTPFERKVIVMKKATSKKPKAKTKKAPAKKPATKKPVKKSTKKK